MFDLDAPMHDGESKKKLVMIGPMAAGKTTFKKVFFENINPLKLLDSSLEPTRGIDTDTYRYFSSMIAVWDLAGQELADWLNERADVLLETDVLVCMLDATSKIKESIIFLVKLLKLREQWCKNSKLFILFNKCDLLPELDVYTKIVNIERIISVKAPGFKDECKRSNFLKTSVVEGYYLKTMLVALGIMKACIEREVIPINPRQFKLVENQLKILLRYTQGIQFSLGDIAEKLSMDLAEAKQILDALASREFLEKKRETVYSVTKKGAFFSSACKKHSDLIQKRKIREDIGLFLNLKQNGET
ncbi:hypothetical protein GF325_11355 [Candidatus Bathyarchaeota archaeon]|nr:hypothetical protein [Candidatus Bathyarchaeota archaeon]